MTASAAGIYGNFGQANYGMAKMGLIGMANTLAIEGASKNVLVNTIAPLAGSRISETVMPPQMLEALKPDYVAPLAAYLCHESCKENGSLFEAGAGFHAKLRWERSIGHHFQGQAFEPEAVAEKWQEIGDFSDATHPKSIGDALMSILQGAGTPFGQGKT